MVFAKILAILMDVQTLIEICRLIHKILNINNIIMLIKNHNCFENKRKIRCNSRNLDLVNINAYTKFYQNLKILHQSRTITLLFMNEISPFAILIHSYPISMPIQSFKKIGQKYFS